MQTKSDHEIITIPADYVSECADSGEQIYLSNLFNRLGRPFPSNCFFVKGWCGIGGTSLALGDSTPTICVMPTVNGVKAKSDAVIGGNKVFAFYGGVSEYLLLHYLNSVDDNPVKICVTYNSLRRLLFLLSKRHTDYSGYRLLVDEAHTLFNAYSYRKPCCQEVIKFSRGFGNVVWMTATPVKRKYLFPEAKDLPIVEVVYTPTTDVRLVRSDSPYSTVKRIVKSRLEGKGLGNLHIFVNSVTFVGKLIKNLPLDNTNCRVLCSTNDNGTSVMNSKTIEPVSISDSLSFPKKVNFYTASAFESIDVYDADAEVFVVSDPRRKKNTAYDVSTTFVQILGRVRDMKRNYVTWIFKENRYNGVTPTEYSALMRDNVNHGEYVRKLVNGEPDMSVRRRLLEVDFANALIADDRYLKVDEDNWLVEFDPMRYNFDEHQFEIMNSDYLSIGGVNAKLMKAGYKGVLQKDVDAKPSDELSDKCDARVKFRDAYLEYSALCKTDPSTIDNYHDRVKLLEVRNHVLHRAYHELGDDWVEGADYNRRRCERELIRRSDKPVDINIARAISKVFTTGSKFTTKQRADAIACIAADLLLPVTPKLSDYVRYKSFPTRKDGTLISGIVVIGSKLSKTV